MHLPEFLERVGGDFEMEIAEPDEICRAVFATLRKFISHGETEKIVSTLPSDLKSLWS